MGAWLRSLGLVCVLALAPSAASAKKKKKAAKPTKSVSVFMVAKDNPDQATLDAAVAALESLGGRAKVNVIAGAKLKKALKDKTISEDLEKDGLDQVQKLTDQFVAKITELGKHKEDEIMKV